MKIFSKYVFPPFITLFFFLLGGAFILVLDIAVPILYDYLAMKFPGVLDKPNSLGDPEAYKAFNAALTSLGIIINVFIATNLSMRCDNKRFEYIVVLTEGLYSVPERLGWYLRTFWLTELISATAAPLLLTLPVYLIPEKYIHGILPALWCGGRLEPYFSIFPGTLIILAAAIVIRLCFIPSVLRGWRVSWLTGSIG